MTKEIKKIYGFYVPSWSLWKKNHSKTPVFYVMFIIDEMVTDSIQNWTD